MKKQPEKKLDTCPHCGAPLEVQAETRDLDGKQIEIVGQCSRCGYLETQQT